jgi:hypothetical protein
MKVSCLLQTLTVAAAATLMLSAPPSVSAQQVSAQQSSAQAQQTPSHRPRANFKIMRRERAENSTTAAAEAGPWPNLYALQQAFTQTYPTIGANSDGTDIWPCTGGSSATGPDPDCPTIGSPTILFPSNATAIGNPAFIWKLKNTPGYGNGQGCDALVNGTGHLGVPYLPCGQVETWYEDDSNDTTDDMLYSMSIVQGPRVLYATGTVDFGTNVEASTTPPSDVIIYNPLNLGFGPGDGPSTGPNNGNCNPNFNYPLAAPSNPGEPFLIAANKTCVEPTPGPATIIVTTALGTPIYTKATGTTCTTQGVASPCYTVEWTKKHEICQVWDIWLE